MSVVSIEIVAGRSSKLDENLVRTYSLPLQVKTDDRDDGGQIVQSAVASYLGGMYSLYSVGNDEDLGAKLHNIDVKEKERLQGSGSVWDVTAEYATDKIEKNDNPLNEPARFSLDWAQHESVVEKDIDGNPIANTVGDLFVDPPLTKDDSRPVLTISKNYAASLFNALCGIMEEYKDVVSSDTFLGRDAGKWKMANITTGDLQTKNDIEYYKLTLQMQLNKDGWAPSILNRGHRFLGPFGATHDFPKKEIRNLNEDGTPLQSGDDPHYIDFDVDDEASFTDLMSTLDIDLP